ncbi:MAG: prolyl oligopeptidase family serine peptidase [Phycisphaerales bacterium JB037]
MRTRPFVVAASLLALAVGSLATAQPPALAEVSVGQESPRWLSAEDALRRARSGEITMELIMSDPAWIARSPTQPRWDARSDRFYFRQRRPDSEITDLFVVTLRGNEPIATLVEPGDMPEVAFAGDRSPDDRATLSVREGDLFLVEHATGSIRQLTRTLAGERGGRFSADGARVIFTRGSSVFVRDLATGLESEPFDLRADDEPEKKLADERKKEKFLAQQQRRLFEHVRDAEQSRAERRADEEAFRAGDPSRVPPTVYLGKGQEIVEASLSPNERFVAVRLRKSGDSSGKRDSMPQYTTASGYVESRTVRDKVGTGTDRTERLVIVEIGSGTQHEVDLAALPGIRERPLAWLKEKEAGDEDASDENGSDAGTEDEGDAESGEMPEHAGGEGVTGAAEDAAGEPEKNAEPETEPKPESPRSVWVSAIEWSDDGERLAVQVRSHDRKDRWIARVDLESFEVVPVERLHDEAWINWRYNNMGWLGDHATLWFLSEQSGYSHLYLHEDGGAEPVALTEGSFVVNAVTLAPDGRTLYFQANPDHPGSYDIFRCDTRAREVERLTELGGLTDYELSPDGAWLLLSHSTLMVPTELYVQAARPGAAARRMTDTVTPEFAAIEWVRPEIVAVPSSVHDRPIYSRVYRPEPGRGNGAAVMFVHGAGYLQNAHKGWSSYFREFMFHSLLVERGYTVIDMDYRASAGYGRDWRTAIYRRMGTPELEDMADGVRWLVEREGVDADRVGVYGGSYGGFMTLMALFTEPDLFACGAALRPVTDWAHYNDGYTGNILNTPEVDPEAYSVSSPIEFADGLRKPLLICHGMQDDNVFYQDTVRLAQRLIELGKEDWEVAAYPIEPHGFRTPSSWLDEYRRILKLFETHLRD